MKFENTTLNGQSLKEANAGVTEAGQLEHRLIRTTFTADTGRRIELVLSPEDAIELGAYLLSTAETATTF